jgi:mRNA-degrading endonuclease YafQ of YafQ-DinJ toxin-antitoxin module
MKYHRTPEFNENYKELDNKQKQEVQKSFPDLKKAFEGDTIMRTYFDLHPLNGWPDIYAGHLKYNLVFTYHYDVDSNGEKVVFFRKIGTHGIYKNP